MANLTISAIRPVDVREEFSGPAGEAITAGQYVRFNLTTGKIELGNATAAAEARSGGLALRTVAAGEAVTVLRKGIVDVGDALAALTYDDDVYLSDTDGTLADAAGTVSKIIGTVVPLWGATTADKALRLDL